MSSVAKFSKISFGSLLFFDSSNIFLSYESLDPIAFSNIEGLLVTPVIP